MICVTMWTARLTNLQSSDERDEVADAKEDKIVQWPFFIVRLRPASKFAVPQAKAEIIPVNSATSVSATLSGSFGFPTPLHNLKSAFAQTFQNFNIHEICNIPLLFHWLQCAEDGSPIHIVIHEGLKAREKFIQTYLTRVHSLGTVPSTPQLATVYDYLESDRCQDITEAAITWQRGYSGNPKHLNVSSPRKCENKYCQKWSFFGGATFTTQKKKKAQSRYSKEPQYRTQSQYFCFSCATNQLASSTSSIQVQQDEMQDEVQDEKIVPPRHFIHDPWWAINVALCVPGKELEFGPYLGFTRPVWMSVPLLPSTRKQVPQSTFTPAADIGLPPGVREMFNPSNACTFYALANLFTNQQPLLSWSKVVTHINTPNYDQIASTITLEANQADMNEEEFLFNTSFSNLMKFAVPKIFPLLVKQIHQVATVSIIT